MNKFFNTIGLICCLSGSLSAATITITNFDAVSGSPFYNPILDASGSLLTSGIVVVGTYTSAPVTFTDVLGGNFVQAGSNSLGLIAPGFFQGSINTPSLMAGDSFVGQSVYMVVGNGATLGSSTQLLAWQASGNPDGDVYVADDPTGGPNSVAVRNSTGITRVGSEVSYDFGDLGVQPAMQLVAIPEPSALLLSVFGFAALLRRRR